MNLSEIKVNRGKLMGYYFYGVGVVLCTGAVTSGTRGMVVYLGAFLLCVGCVLLSTRIEKDGLQR